MKTWLHSLFVRHAIGFFSIVGFAALLLVLISTWNLVSKTAHDSVLDTTQASNLALTQVFANESWATLRLLFPEQSNSPEAIRNNPALPAIDENIRRFGQKTDIVKVKIYNPAGLTIYSSEARQIGEDKSANAGFQSALKGIPASELSFRGVFNSFDAELHDRNLVSSYVPVFFDDTIEAVAEIYTDRTASIKRTEDQLDGLFQTIFAVFIAVYFGFLFFVRQLDNARKAHERSLETLAEESAKAKAAADGANLVKSQFLATMSHEIRTPITGVLGMADLLKDTPLSAEQSGYVKNISISGTALLSIINDILDLSKIESGKMEFERHPFSLNAIVEHSKIVLEARVAEKKISLLTDMADHLDDARLGDSVRIRQILLNLLGNAVKFTEKGSVTLRISANGTAQNFVLFEIIDTGIGLSPEAISRLFTNFSQADASTTRRYGGTGLGLSICKKMVEGMGGEIGVESRLGQGSRFWFSLPLPVCSQPLAAAAKSHEAPDCPAETPEKIEPSPARETRVRQLNA